MLFAEDRPASLLKQRYILMSNVKTIESTEVQKLEEAILGLIKSIQNNPEQAHVVFRANSKLEHGFLADVNVRNFNFKSDEPIELGGTNQGPNPVEYVLGAFAACQEIVIKAYATVLGIQLNSVEVDVEGDLDLHGFLNLTEARPGFTSVRYNTKIETTETDSVKLQQLEELSIKRCPVLDIVRNAVQVKGAVNFKQP